MKIFSRVDKDLNLLRLSLADLQAACEADVEAVYDQIDHYCFRIAWKEHVRTGAPVRDLLHVIAGNAHSRLMELVPNEEPEYDDDLLFCLIKHAQRKNEVFVCFGFFLKPEYQRICRSAVEGTFPPAQSIFETVPWHSLVCLVDQPSRLHAAHAGLLKLREFWQGWTRKVATDPLTRETVRIVAAATGEDPLSTGTFWLDHRLGLLESWIEESGVPMRINQGDLSIERIAEAW